ncbi:hypothetical protein FBQ97_11675 [Acidobacteria bacterium ACD]|nr:MAG: hypothetical protein EDX89_13280 [Acidobacteriota bacterium]MCE7958201.1 hypothetical protein [Acidobacteria bacterium ACB2]MDL1950456.1 hypothetical protein [Acidobacteria bacterium ACD]
MRAYEIFRRLSNDELDAVVLAACEDEEIPDKIAGGVLTFQKIPLTRFAKLGEETRKAYVRRTLRDRQSADLSLFVVSAALLQGKAEMIAAFLESLGVPHDGPHVSVEGEIPEPEPEKLDAAIEALFAAYPARDVAIYLHAFASQPDVRWKTLDARLLSEPRLSLGEPE